MAHTTTPTPPVAPESSGAYDHPGQHGHPPHLAHHFDTPEQQFETGKIGMWVFLATEVLMFGGLFCAYAVYRATRPEVFLYAHTYLDTMLGAVNTVILLASSLTMAWAVRAAQLNQKKLLIGLLFATLLGGAGFMVIKAVEYAHKYHDGLFAGRSNIYFPGQEQRLQEHLGAQPVAPSPAQPEPEAPVVPEPPPAMLPAGIEPSLIQPPPRTAMRQPPPPVQPPEPHSLERIPDQDRERIHIFFQIYYLMTGLHGIHVVVGLGLIFWIALRASSPRLRRQLWPTAPLAVGAYIVFCGILVHHNPTIWVGGVIAGLSVLWLLVALVTSLKLPAVGGEFSSEYYTPVDLVGLYWHLVDLIWIFLFPLLYLIH